MPCPTHSQARGNGCVSKYTDRTSADVEAALMQASGWGSVCRAPTRALNGGNIRVEDRRAAGKESHRDQRYWRAMSYLRMRDCNVVLFTPRRAAAPFGPPTLPFASSNAFMIRSRSIISDA